MLTGNNNNNGSHNVLFIY